MMEKEWQAEYISYRPGGRVDPWKKAPVCRHVLSCVHLLPLPADAKGVQGHASWEQDCCVSRVSRSERSLKSGKDVIYFIMVCF